MRKEVPIAIFVGSLVGVLFAGFIWKSSSNNGIAQDSTIKEIINETRDGDSFLKLDIPKNLSTHSEKLISVKGSTNPEALVAVLLNEESSLSQADNTGNFNLTIDLDAGINSISVYASVGRESFNEDLQVVHSTKVEGTNLRSIFGTVTDITESSIQVREEGGEIMQVAISENTTYANIIRLSKEVSFEDVAIGDYIAVLDDPAQRVLITTANTTTLTAAAGRVDVFNDNEFEIINSEGNRISIDAKGGVIVTHFDEGKISNVKLSTLKVGDNIFVIGKMKDELNAEKIHIF